MVDPIDDEEKKQIIDLRKRIPELTVDKFEDGFIARWIRVLANGYDIDKVENALKKHLLYRKAWGLDDLLTWKRPSVAQKCYPYGYPCYDREGSPVLLTLFGYMDVEGLMKSFHSIDYIKTSLQHLEEGLKMAKVAAKKKGIPYDQVVMVIDVGKLATAHYTFKPFTYSYLTLVSIFQENYPLVFKKIIAINAPSIAQYAYTLLTPFLSENIQKLVEMPGENWKEVLFQNVDPDEWPAYWGGNKIEANNDEKCQSKILFHEGPVPESYYIKESMEEDNTSEAVTVYAGDKHLLDFDVQTENAEIHYKFCTKGEDIGLAIYYDGVGEHKDTTKMEQLFPYIRLECSLVPIEGTWKCEKKGKYVIEFDNYYSWFSAKELYYKIKLQT